MSGLPDTPTLAPGGVICVMLGEGGELPTEYVYHAQVLPLLGHQLEPRAIDNAIPHNCKALIFGGGRRLPRDVFDATHEIIKRRRLAYLTKDNPTAVAQSIAQLLPPVAQPRDEGSPSERKAAEQRELAARGSIKEFISRHTPDLLKKDRTLSAAELGRQLFEIARANNVRTTVGSLTQAVRLWQKDQQRSGVPTSAVPLRVKLSRQLEEMQLLLSQVVPYVKELEEENDKLHGQIGKAREVFQTFSGDLFPKS